MSVQPSGPAVVIGGGVAGLATAVLLAQDGFETVLLERQEELGGRVAVLARDGFLWDRGPSWWLMPEAFEHFYQLLGTSTAEQLDLVQLTSPAFRIFSGDSAPLDVPPDQSGLRELFEQLEPGSGPALERYLAAAGEDYDTAVDSFLYTTFKKLGPSITKPVRRRLGHLAAVLTQSLERDVARRFQDVRLRQLLTFAAVFLANEPARTPALYGLMNYTTFAHGVLYPRGGFGTFVESLRTLAQQRGVNIQLGAQVEQIEVAAGQVHGVTYQQNGRTHRIETDTVISAADRHHTETKLLASAAQTGQLRPRARSRITRRWRRRDPGIGCVLAYLGVQGELPELAHHSLFFSQDWNEDFRAVFPKTPGNNYSKSIYVSRTSATDPATAPPGHENLFILIPVPAVSGGQRGSLFSDDDALRTGDPDLETTVDEVLDLIEQRAGIPDLRSRVVSRHTVGPGDFENQFNSWRGSALGLAHTLSQSAFLRGSQTSAAARGLYFAGATTTPGVGLPMCLISAENILKTLRGDTSATPLTPVTKGAK